MTGIHSLWTAPRRVANLPIEFTRLDVLVWIYAVLTFRRYNGPVWLFTDAAGRDYASKIGVATLYDKIIMLPKGLEGSINPSMFWAATKIIALAETPCPCVNMDFDSVLLSKMKIWSYCTAGHTEPADWDYYRDVERLYRSVGLEQFGQWDATPVNASIVGWRSDECRLFYAQTALTFMETYSQMPELWGHHSRSKSNPMVFAEQKLLGMSMARLGHSVKTLGTLRDPLPILKRPSQMHHLWAEKTVYESATSDIRSAACRYVIEKIFSAFPSARWMLDLLPDDNGKSIWPIEGPDNAFTRTIDRVCGKVAIHDPIFPIYRQATDGCKIYYGEYLGCDKGASCRVVEAGGKMEPFTLDYGRWPDYRSDIVWRETPTDAKAESGKQKAEIQTAQNA